MFKSVLAKEMMDYLKLREPNLSHTSFLHYRRTLISLDQYLVDIAFSEKALSEDILEAWMLTLTGSSKTVREKICVSRNFSKYLNSIGYKAFLLDSPRVKSDYIPYIYSDEEIRKILYFADNLQLITVCGNKAAGVPAQLKVPMIIRILYSCGTRVEETLSLQRKDIDFKAGTILLKNTKFSKERLIPVHESLLVILERYCATLGILSEPDALLFPSKYPNKHYCARAMQTWFTRILAHAEIDQKSSKSNKRGACLHCFRHLFVLKAIQQLEAKGRPVDMNDLLLPTYLGHSCLIDTDKYMRFSGVRDDDVIEAFESYTEGLIPRIEVPYEEE